MYKVVSTDLLKPGVPEEAVLKSNDAELIFGDCKNENELIELTRDADAVIDIYAQITARVINEMSKCKIIVRRGIGYDSVDVDAATKKGIYVANVPDYCVDEVADHAVTLMLTAARKIITAREQTMSGGWDFKLLAPIKALGESTLGLVAFGRIPRAICKRAKSFGINVIVCDPYISKEVAAEYGVNVVDLETLIKSSDFISVHAPLSEETRNMFSDKEFNMMKPTAVFINTSRGSVVDEKALYGALSNKKIAFAALDVLEKEPPKSDNPLLKLDNIIITPHTGWFSEHAVVQLGISTAEEVVRVLKGQKPKSPVNPEVLS